MVDRYNIHLISVTLLVVVVLSQVSTQQFYSSTRYGKREPVGRGFMTGSRFGRSGSGVVVPRSNQFMMGSRFGKRGVATTTGEGLLPSLPTVDDSSEWPEGEAGLDEHGNHLICDSTGILNLYQCYEKPPPLGPL